MVRTILHVIDVMVQGNNRMPHKCLAEDCNRMVEEPYKVCSIECSIYSGSWSICPDCDGLRLVEVIKTDMEIYSKCTECGLEFVTPSQMERSLNMMIDTYGEGI